jgi:hypothetical protein
LTFVRNAGGERCRMSCIKKQIADIVDGHGGEAIQ